MSTSRKSRKYRLHKNDRLWPLFYHSRKPRVLSPLRSLRVRNEVDLELLACEDVVLHNRILCSKNTLCETHNAIWTLTIVLKDFAVFFFFCWQVPLPLLNGTILSYQQGNWENLLVMRSGPTLTFQIWNQSIDSEIQFRKNTWYHVVWTWNSEGNYVCAYSILSYFILSNYDHDTHFRNDDLDKLIISVWISWLRRVHTLCY